jgi:hypothetical protein
MEYIECFILDLFGPIGPVIQATANLGGLPANPKMKRRRARRQNDEVRERGGRSHTIPAEGALRI